MWLERSTVLWLKAIRPSSYPLTHFSDFDYSSPTHSFRVLTRLGENIKWQKVLRRCSVGHHIPMQYTVTGDAICIQNTDSINMFAHLNLLKTISALSYSMPEFKICSATKFASVNSGGFRPISVKCIKMLSLNCRWRMVRTLSPTQTNFVVLASWPLSNINERM